MSDDRVDVRRVLIVATVASLLLGAVAVVALALNGDVPRGIEVLGVDIGGQSRTDAELILHQAFDPRAGEPVEVERLGVRRSISPYAIGLVLEVDLTVGKAIRSGPPVWIGKRSLPPVVHLDRAALAAVLGLTGDKKAAAVAVKEAWLAGRTARITT